MMPADGWDILRRHDAILFGAIGHPDVPDHITLHGLLLPMRRQFDQYVNLRPAYLFDGVPSPLRDKAPGSIDMLVYRENTEGEYAPDRRPALPGHAARDRHPDTTSSRAAAANASCAPPSRAPGNGRKKVTSITKSNAQTFGMVLWDEVFKDGEDATIPTCKREQLLVDAAAMDFVRKPEAFDVVVASNLFGDILTDLSADRHRQHGPGGQRQHQSGADLSEHVRAGPRLGAGHRRQGHRQSAGGDPVGGDAAGSSRIGEKCGGGAARWRLS